MANNVRLSGRVPGLARAKRRWQRAPSRRAFPQVISKCNNKWFIDCDPMLNSVPISFEQKFTVVLEIIPINSTQHINHSKLILNINVFMKKISIEAYTIERFKKPPYLSSRACGVSKCNIVTNGLIPLIKKHRL